MKEQMLLIQKDDDNFVQIFKLPKYIPSAYCFGEGHTVEFTLVDWFRAISPLLYNKLDDLDLVKFIKQKPYYSSENSYLIISRQGKSLVIP